MTQVITRYFDSVEQARLVRRELLYQRRVSQKIMRLYEEADGVADMLIAADVAADTAQAYQKNLAKGGAVLMVRAGYKPLSVAQTTRDVTAEMGAIDMGGLVEEVTVPDAVTPRRSVLSDHPLMLSRPRDPYATNVHMADWPIPLISRRKPYTGSLIPRHQRMANWPFPHLINGKTGTNSLMPGGPRMANFPISLLSGRKPFDKSIFGRHARMASFPISLISRRKPFTGSMFPRHARMADVILPLVVKHGDSAPPSSAKSFSFSRLFGLPTLIRR